MDAGKEADDQGEGGQSVDQEISDASSIWQTNLIKIGITLIVILISALWFCWNRVQNKINNVTLAHNILHQPKVKPLKKKLGQLKDKISDKFKQYRSGLNLTRENDDETSREPIFGVPKYSHSGRKLRQRERAMILASKLLNLRKEPIRYNQRDMPDKLLNPDFREIEDKLPEEINMMYKTVRVFGHFDKPVFLSLCKHMQVETLQEGEFLFKRGQKDEWIYVIQSGKISLLALYEDTEYSISEIGQGESIASLLSVLDVLTGDLAPYKTVSAVALEESIIIKLPAEAISKEFENYPASLVRIVQMITLRLQRVTFLALHDYLGLSEELINPNAMTSLKRSNSRRSTNSFSSDEFPRQKTRRSTLATHEGPPLTESAESSDTTPGKLKRSSSMTMRARFNTLEKVITDDGTIYNRPNAENKNADFSASVETAFSREEIMESPDQNTPTETPTLTAVPSDETNDSQLQAGIDSLAVIFGLEDSDLIAKRVQMYSIKEGTVISREGDQDPSLYYVVKGRLIAEQEMGERKSVLYEAVAGSLSGQLSVLTGEPTFFKTYAKQNSLVLRMTKVDFYSLMADYPKVVLNLAHTVVSRLSSFVRQIDFALDWVLVEAGKALYSQGEPSDCLYIVLNGRLRSVKEHQNGKKEMVCEFGRSECVGLVDSYTDQPRSTSVHAIRDTEVARIPAALMHHIKRVYPTTVTNIISLMTDQVINQKFKNPLIGDPHRNIFSQKPENYLDESEAYRGMSNHLANISTVAILSSDKAVPVDLFTSELMNVLKQHGPTQKLNSEAVKKRLGDGAMEANNEYRLTTWLGQQEDVHKMTLYQCDTTLTNWTTRCLRQADCILIVAMGDSKPKIGELEVELENYAFRALKVLVLLHKETVESPTRTAEWLNLRGWLTNHFHIKIPSLMLTPKAQRLKKEIILKIRKTNESPFSDFSRLARFLTGKSIALVLGGGGARGILQIGVIQKLQERGIPIDAIGGTSIGSFMGALYASSRDIDVMKKRASAFSVNMSLLWRKVIDLTYPIMAMFTGNGLNNEIRTILGDKQIEDLWIPYFCITTDLSASRMRVHSFGSLWRYVRGSMTLTGYLPPICDPVDGHYLVDGGYINNLPADVAKARGASAVIAIDVGARDHTDLHNFGDAISGWWLLWKKWWPWTEPVKVPDLNDIQSRLAYIACSHLLEEVISADFCHYLRSDDIQKFKTLDFDRFDEILAFGEEFAQRVITDEWAQNVQNKVKDTDDHQTPLLKRKQAGWQQANTDFIDLAQFMVKIPKMDKDGEKYKRPFLSECSDNDDLGFVAPLDFNSDSEIPRARDKERRESLNI